MVTFETLIQIDQLILVFFQQFPHPQTALYICVFNRQTLYVHVHEISVTV